MRGLSTRAIAAAPRDLPTQRSVALPIHQTTTFEIDDALNAAFERGDYRSEYLYTRHSNPTVDALQRRLAELHAAADCVCTASGMAAVSSALLALTEPGETVIADTVLYGATQTFLSRYLAQMGRGVRFVRLNDRDAVGQALASATRPTVVYGETVSNPLVEVLDLPAVAAASRAAGARLIVDNTFCNPVLCRPLEHGADVVIESLSKSIAGHSDVHGGAVLGDRPTIERVWHAMVHFGGCLDPHAAYLVWRGLKTVVMRTHAAQSNAVRVAEALRSSPEVERVYAPPVGGGESPWLAGPGAMVSFVVVGGDARAQRLLDGLEVITPATSLGGVESLVSLPYNTSHRTAESRASVGLLPGTVRLSVGCEDVSDLITDLLRALSSSA